MEDLYRTRDEKRKSDEDKTKAEQLLAQEANQKMEEEMKKAEEKIELAHEATWKMEEAMNKILELSGFSALESAEPILAPKWFRQLSSC